MARPVYSSQLIVYTDAAPNTEFEVPSGYTAVIRQLSAVATVAATLVQVQIQNSPSAPPCIIWSPELVGLEVSSAEEGRWVVPAGGIISLNLGSLADGLNVYVGGYLLTED